MKSSRTARLFEEGGQKREKPANEKSGLQGKGRGLRGRRGEKVLVSAGKTFRKRKKEKKSVGEKIFDSGNARQGRARQ